MANKRIKISELPKIVYDPQAVGTTTSVTSGDYMPVAVTDRVDATLKTTMAITTRELQRFVLGQNATEEFDNDVLKIGRGGDHRVEISNLTVTDMTVTGTSNFGNASYSNLNVDNTLTIGASLLVGGSTYPSKLFDRNESNPSNRFKANMIPTTLPGGVLDGSAVSLASLLATSPVTTNTTYEGRTLTVGANGALEFTTTNLGATLEEANAISTSPTHGGLLLMIGNTGGLSYTTQANLNDTSSNTYTVDIKADNVADTVIAMGATVPTAMSKDGQQVFTTSSATPTLSADVELAPAASIEINTSQNALSATPVETQGGESDQDDATTTRTVFKSPIVLGTKHQDDVDLTERVNSIKVNAQVGEIRWNIHNNVPTIYLAVARDLSPGGDPTIRSCVWYGIPLFGTIDHENSLTLTNSVTAHSYEDED